MAVNPKPTAVFCASDEMAVGLRAEALKTGLDVPGDLSIVGFDDHDVAAVVGLTTVAQPVFGAGRLAADVLDRLVRHDDANEWTPEHHELTLDLLVRSTTAPPAH